MCGGEIRFAVIARKPASQLPNHRPYSRPLLNRQMPIVRRDRVSLNVPRSRDDVAPGNLHLVSLTVDPHVLLAEAIHWRQQCRESLDQAGQFGITSQVN